MTPGTKRKVNPHSHISIIQSPPVRIRQRLIRFLNPNKLLGILLNPTRRRNIRVILPS
ncbi:hypothetical protein HanXRQr2_Chr14g0635011 [Helianthus annuus]|uniref:Uncharacterized protein n=1 Tax=Helianthus annuus TaxID=4232 RepID=A0A9K3E851_HELAN|nr:hypothetical protein HanXRQr2_Chr14g0635011 [Helianthus annuus]